MKVIFFENDEELLREALNIRREVFVEEQGVPEEEELDGKDSASVHVLLEKEGKFIGTARIRKIDDGTFKIERVAILKEERGKGYGRFLMENIERELFPKGVQKIVLNAQIQVREFYERLGYRAEGEIFYEANIPHVRMVKVVKR